jgi:hypothetical protein
MVYVILSKIDTSHRKKIIEYVRLNIKNNGIKYQFIFVPDYIIEKDINFIDKGKDIVLWQPLIANINLELLKSFVNSIVILSKPTVYLQKISKYNPINENMAINHRFYIVYISPKKIDITNNEWKLVVKEEMFIISIEKLLELIKYDKNNIKKDFIPIIKIENIDDTDLTKNQVNLS